MPGLNEAQRSLMAEWQALSGARLNEYAEAWAGGRINLATYQELFKGEVRDLYIAGAWTARGSVEATTQSDYGRIGRMLRDQYGYAADFFEAIGRGELSLPEIQARSQLYVESARQALEAVGQAAAGAPQLPAQPGDGSTQCRTRCKCTWRIEQVPGGFDCYWELNPAEHCPDCLRRAREWSPLKVRNGRVVK